MGSSTREHSHDGCARGAHDSCDDSTREGQVESFNAKSARGGGALVRPGYAEEFRCIGPSCEDSCCTGWVVTFDRESCRKYETMADGPLKVLMDEHVVRQPVNADGTEPAQFAKVRVDSGSGCPFLNGEKLCQIQVEHGESYLSTTCATYPRVVHRIDGLEEKTLSLSCPESARLVLLSPDLLGRRWNRQSSNEVAAVELEEAQSFSRRIGGMDQPFSLLGSFWLVREFIVRILVDRRYAIWQRLFLIGVFVRRLDAFALRWCDLDSQSDGFQRGQAMGMEFTRMLNDFQGAMEQAGEPIVGVPEGTGGVREKMEAIEPDLRLQLDMVLRLAGLRLSRSHVGERFVETIGWFKEGLGVVPQATLESLIVNYRFASETYFEPFFALHPHILENLLINMVFRTLFPYGLKVGTPGWKPAMEHEFALMAAHFGLLKGLLIGVAGCHREGLSVEHVVHTVQAASKHFEHHPAFLEEAHRLLSRNDLANLRGLTMLLRN